MSEVVNGNPINNANPIVPRSFSKFTLNEAFADTHRFGEYHPHLVIECVSKDKMPWRCVHETRSYTLKAPLMQDIQMHKDYILINQRCILPFQSERIDKIPKLGDDVPADAYTSVSDFANKILSFAASFNALINDTSLTDEERCTFLMQKWILLESVFSRGSVLASLGCNLKRCCLVSEIGEPNKDIDDALEDFFDVFKTWFSNPSNSIEVHIDGIDYIMFMNVPRYAFYGSYTPLSFRDFLQMIRDTSDWYFGPGALPSSVVSGLLAQHSAKTFFGYNNNSIPIDLGPLWAYQIGMAHFMTNDDVDFIYSADLFRQYIFSLYRIGGAVPREFNWNGSTLQYDYLSARYFNSFVSRVFSSLTSAERVSTLQFFLTLFGYKRSLRYRDYFVGSRPRPLAVESTGAPIDVPVVSNKVSVIDITKSRWAQSLLNAVHAAESGWEEFMQDIYGEMPNKDMHDPIFLGHVTDSMFASEVENTADAQQNKEQSVTANFRSRSSNFEFSTRVKEFCYIIGVTSYDIKRLYPDVVRRNFFIRDRYDRFIPQMQFIGDQVVYRHELLPDSTGVLGTPFAYQFHDMQYKQLVNRCAGAFDSDNLPGFAFMYHSNQLSDAPFINPDFIRAKNSELDEFYLSLTHFSLGNYFHFITFQENICDSERPMVRKPQII